MSKLQDDQSDLLGTEHDVDGLHHGVPVHGGHVMDHVGPEGDVGVQHPDDLGGGLQMDDFARAGDSKYRQKHLPHDVREKAVECFLAGMMAKQVCADFGISQTTLRRWRREAEKNKGQLHGIMSTKVGGRRRHLTKVDEDMLREIFSNNPFATNDDLRSMVDNKVSSSTITRTFQRLGFPNRRKRRMMFVTAEQASAGDVTAVGSQLSVEDEQQQAAMNDMLAADSVVDGHSPPELHHHHVHHHHHHQ